MVGKAGFAGPVSLLTEAERRIIASVGQVRAHAPGERIIEEGAPASGFSIIESGRVEVVKDGWAVAEVGEHGVVGEMALFNANVHTAEVRALEPCQVLFVPTAAFFNLVLQQEAAAVKLMESLGQLMVGRLQELDAEILGKSDGQEADEFAALRKRLLADWALAIPRSGEARKADGLPVETRGDCGRPVRRLLARGRRAVRGDPRTTPTASTTSRRGATSSA